MRNWQGTFKSKVSRRWFGSILLVVASVLLVTLLLCAYLLQSLRGNMMRMSEDMAAYMRHSIDSRIDEIQNNTVQFELHSVNNKLKKMRHLPFQITDDIYQLCNLLYTFKNSGTLVNNIYIYYPGMDGVAAGTGLYEAPAYFRLLALDYMSNYALWNPSQGLPENSRFVCSRENGKDHLLFVRNMRYEGNVMGVIVVELDLDELLRTTRTMGNTSDISTLSLIVNGQHLLPEGAQNTPEASVISSIQGMEEESMVQAGGLTAYVENSYFPGLYYVAGYDQGRLFAPLYTAGGICFLGILLCVVAAVYFSIHISRRNAQPLERILEKFPGQAGGSLDEYQYISGKIDQLIQEKFKSEEKLQERQALIDAMFLNTVLKGDLTEEPAVFSAARQCEVEFENPVFQVMILQARSPLGEAAIPPMLARCADLEQEALVATKDGRLVLLLNPEAPLHERAANLLAKELLAALARPAACGVGAGYDSMAAIYQSYTEALRALPPVPVGRGNAFGFCSRTGRREASSQQGLAAMKAFTRHLHAGRYDKAGESFALLREDYLSTALRPAAVSRRVSTVQTILLDELEKQGTAGEKPPSGLLRRLDAVSGTEELWTAGSEALALLAKAGAKAATEAVSIPERAKGIIQQNLNDPMLGLYMISGLLEVSNSYLSACFKNAFGVGVVQYINGLRIERAKELILTTEASVKEIALQTGFTSDISFIRVFKKYENKTPAALRKTAED